MITRYDKYVSTWYTFNERTYPLIVCYCCRLTWLSAQYCNWQYSYYPAGNDKGNYPAYNNISGGLEARIACSHYTILAHAKVAKWYHEEFYGAGRISFKNSGNYYEPENKTSAADIDAVARQYEFALGWFNGCWRDGDYSDMLKETLGDLLLAFTQEEKDMIKGSCDFFAIDAYTGYLGIGIEGDSAACAADPSNPNYPECAGSSSLAADGFPLGPNADYAMSWLYSTPVAIRRFLSVITKELFPAVPGIVVSEFGFAEPREGEETSLSNILWDLRRADYYQGFLGNILAATVEDSKSYSILRDARKVLTRTDVNVTGAFGWAIFDNFEWFSGSRVKFGLQYLNQTSMERIPKASMFQFLDWFKTHDGSAPSNNTSGVNGTYAKAISRP